MLSNTYKLKQIKTDFTSLDVQEQIKHSQVQQFCGQYNKISQFCEQQDLTVAQSLNFNMQLTFRIWLFKELRL
jgi:hypothetical protein